MGGGMIRDLLDMLAKTPTNFPNNPAGYAGNQSAHAFLIGGGAAVALSYVLPGWWAIAVVAVAYAAWEVWQLVAAGADWADCLEDWLYVMIGSVLLLSGWHIDGVRWAWLIFAGMQAVGIVLRAR